MSWKIFVASCSAAAVAGVVVGGVYEAVVSYDGPNATDQATLPTPTESAPRPVPTTPRPEVVDATVGSRTVSVTRPAPAKATPANAGPAKKPKPKPHHPTAKAAGKAEPKHPEHRKRGSRRH